MPHFHRRDWLRNIACATGSAALAPFVANMRAYAEDDAKKMPKRFVFVTRANGLLPYGIQPVGLEGEVNGPANTNVRRKETTALKLNDYDLHATMQSLNPFKSKMNIIQGLSAQMCGGNHSSHYGALGVYSMSAGGAPKDETIDSKLARAHPGIFPHLGLMLASKGKQILNPLISASGPAKPISYYADPLLAYQDLFGAAASGGGKVAAKSALDANLLDFMVAEVKRLNAELPSSEREKLGRYLEGFEALRNRRSKIASMQDVIKRGAPPVDDKYQSEVEVDRLEAHFDIAAAALVTGLTQVVAISTDSLETRYSGLGLGAYTVHAIGHMEVKGIGSTKSPAKDGSKEASIAEGRVARDTIRKSHMDLLAGLAAKLDSVPEGDGTMLDNTMIIYFAHSGDRHHPNFFTWPIVTLGGLSGTIETGQYLRYASHGELGHQTLGNFYTTMLHAAGLPQDGFGQKDVQLGPEIDQESPLSHLLT